MIRILHVIGSLHIGGSQSFVVNLERHVDSNRFAFDYVVFPEDRSGFYKEVMAMGSRIFVCPRYVILNHFSFLKWWERFFKNHPEYSIVHGHVRSTAALYLKIAKKFGCSTIVHSHSVSDGKGIKAFLERMYEIQIPFVSDFFFACSREAGLWLFGDKIVGGDRFFVVPNGIDVNSFGLSLATRANVRKELGIPVSSFVLGNVGRFAKVKNHSFLLDVFFQFLKIDSSGMLLLVGDGNLRSDIENKARKMGLTNRIIFVGSTDSPAKFYQAMDYFIFPSFWEGFGTAALEAQASGLPCLVSSSCSKAVLCSKKAYSLDLSCGADKWAAFISETRLPNRQAVDEIDKKAIAFYDVSSSVNIISGVYSRLEGVQNVSSKA
jgi:glycosyltransferase involved in cell wall biosynthesis